MSFTEFETDTEKLFLKSVNVLLQTIGEPPLESEDDISNILEATIAAEVLVETKKEILTEGWDINTDEDVLLSPSSSNSIELPFNILSAFSEDGDLIPRGSKLYSKSRQSTVFTEPIEITMVVDIAFNELPHSLRNYITIAAARRFQARQVMDTSIYAYTSEEEEKAMMVARRSEGRNGQYNMLTSGNYARDLRLV
jgi:hypothetical protein